MQTTQAKQQPLKKQRENGKKNIKNETQTKTHNKTTHIKEYFLLLFLYYESILLIIISGCIIVVVVVLQLAVGGASFSCL